MFTDDGDGRRVKSALTTDLGTTTAYFIGNYYEVVSSTRVNKYYYAGTQRIAIRSNSTLYYMFTDYLGSTSLVAFENGNPLSEMRYSAWGEVRFSWIAGQSTTPAYLLPNYTFTGQYSDSYINMLWYNSRHYDPALGRFIQPDSIVPTAVQGVQAYDRFGYVSNNPVRYNDPTGHCPICISALAGAGIGFLVSYGSQAIKNYNSGMELSEALNINNMDKGEILVATVGGTVAGATMGLAAPVLAGAMTSELGAYMIDMPQFLYPTGMRV